jgi:hypothetical protein
MTVNPKVRMTASQLLAVPYIIEKILKLLDVGKVLNISNNIR